MVGVEQSPIVINYTVTELLAYVQTVVPAVSNMPVTFLIMVTTYLLVGAEPPPLVLERLVLACAQEVLLFDAVLLLQPLLKTHQLLLSQLPI